MSNPLPVQVIRPKQSFGVSLVSRAIVFVLDSWLVMLFLPSAGVHGVGWGQSLSITLVIMLLFGGGYDTSYLMWTKASALAKVTKR